MEKYTCLLINADSRISDINDLFSYLAQRVNEDWSKTEAAEMLLRIIYISTFPASFTIFIESGYVDRVYRDIYYHHYASRHFSQPRNCQRLFFFEGVDEDPGVFPKNAEKRFIGVCVIQPNGIIGRSYWNPHYFLEKGHYVRTSKYTVTLLGRKLHIEAFPYTMQDREATTCAEVTVLNLVEYYSQSYKEYPSTLLSDIEHVESQHSAERVFPSQGMNYADVARSLAQVGLSPRIYTNRASYISKDALQHCLYYYIESGIPFGVAVESPEQGILHSVVCIGHGSQDKNWPGDWAVKYLAKEIDALGEVDFRACWIANTADAYHTFVIMDDNDRPYQTVHLSVASENWSYPKKRSQEPIQYAVQQLCVPFYKRVFLEADGAAEVFTTFLTSRMGFQAVMDRYGNNEWGKIGLEKNNPLIVRIFLASSSTFFHQRMQTLDKMDPQKMDEHYTEVYQNLYFPRFVWVCELYSLETYQAEKPLTIGEIVLDATARRTGSMGGIDSIVLVHYPHYITYRDPDSDWKDLALNSRQLDRWSPFPQFRGNLRDFSSYI